MCLRDTKGVAIKIVGSVLGIAIQRNFEEEINKLKYYDILTDTPNRKLFISTLENEIIKSKGTYKQIKHAILFIDLDNFKEVNDTLGHTYGDEFFILMKSIKDYSKISRLCVKLQSLLNCAIRIDNKHVYTSASIGIAIFPNDGYDTNILLKNADTAMYSAKNNGKARYSFFNESMSSIIVRRKNLYHALLLIYRIHWHQ